LADLSFSRLTEGISTAKLSFSQWQKVYFDFVEGEYVTWMLVEIDDESNNKIIEAIGGKLVSTAENSEHWSFLYYSYEFPPSIREIARKKLSAS